MGQQSTKYHVHPSTPLPSNRILVIAKGLYDFNHPLLVHNHPSLHTALKVKLALKDKKMETVPQSDPNFQPIPVTSTSYNFQNCHFHIPKLESLSGFLISLSLNYDQNAAVQHHTLIQQQAQQAQAQAQEQQQQQQSSSTKPTTPSQQQQQQTTAGGTGYISSLFAAVKNEIVGTVASELQGVGFVDLRPLMHQKDIYHNITVAIMTQNHIVCKIDLSVVIPGLKTEIFEMRNFVIQSEVKLGELFVKSFERMVSTDISNESNELINLRSAKLKAEEMANRWINSHVNHRIEVVSVGTTHVNSARTGIEMFTVQVWYKFLGSFLDEARQLEEERLRRLKQQQQEKEEKEKQQESQLTSQMESVSLSPPPPASPEKELVVEKLEEEEEEVKEKKEEEEPEEKQQEE